MRPPFSVAASQPSQPFHLAEGKSRHIPLARPQTSHQYFQGQNIVPLGKGAPLFYS